MGLSNDVIHIWSRDNGAGGRIKLDESDVTITEMIQDELQRLDTQQTKEFYDQPSGSGAITAMEATYPNPLMSNSECDDQNTKLPEFTWTVDHGGNTNIMQQCAFLNGKVVSEDENWTNELLDGQSNVDSEDCGPECFQHKLPNDYKLRSIYTQDLWPAGSRTVDVDAGPQDLGELYPPVNYELSFTIKIDDSGLDSGDKDYLSIVHVTAIRETGGTDFPRLLFHKVDDSQNHVMYVREQTYMQNFIVEGTTVFAAGQTYEIKVTKEVVGENSRVSLYVDGVLEGADELDKDWYREYEGSEGRGRLKVGWSPESYVRPAQATISNAQLLDSDSNILAINKQSYCVQTKYETTDGIKVTTRCTTGLQYDGTPMDVFPRMLGKEGVSISWLDTRYEDTSGYRVYKYDASVPFAEDTSARLLKEIPLQKEYCGLTHDYLDFRDTTTGSEPGIEVGYAIVPLKEGGEEDRDKVGVSGYYFAPSSSERRRRLTTSSTTSGFIVTVVCRCPGEG